MDKKTTTYTLFLVLFFSSSSAFAQTGVDFSVIGAFFQSIVEGLIDNVLTWVAILGLIVLSVGAWFGRFPWEWVGRWLLGCVLVFAAISIVEGIKTALSG